MHIYIYIYVYIYIHAYSNVYVYICKANNLLLLASAIKFQSIIERHKIADLAI